jgi:hypothetical protein
MRKFLAICAFFVISATFSAAGLRNLALFQPGSLFPGAAEPVAGELVQPIPTPDPADMIMPEDLHAFDNFGTVLACDDDFLAVGAPNTELAGARNVGSVYLYQKSGDEWRQVAWLIPDPAQADSRFGSALALDGDTLIVGAPYEYNPGAGNASGAVYVFTRNRDGWSQEVRIAVEDGRPFDLFGGALALNGRHLAVGGRAVEGGDDQRDAGAVYVYRQDRRNWSLLARLGGEAAAFDHFGSALAFADDELLVGAPDTDHPAGISDAGQVYVYRYTRNNWAWLASLNVDEPRPQARFGAGLTVQGDMLAVIAPQEYQEDGPVPPNAIAYATGLGAVHVFERKGEQWHRQARLLPEAADEQHEIWVSGAAMVREGGQSRLVLSGYGRGLFYPFVQQDNGWQALAAIEVPYLYLIEGQALVAADDQLLLGDRFYDIQQTSWDPLQAVGVVWIIDW